jgi:hypothetical protein
MGTMSEGVLLNCGVRGYQSVLNYRCVLREEDGYQAISNYRDALALDVPASELR